MKKRIIFLVFILSGLSGFLMSYYLHNNRKSENQVVTIQTFHSPALLAKQWEGDPKAGEKIFKEFCATCHAKEPMIDVTAPRIGDKKIWKSFKKTGKENLLQHTIQGGGAMPARGGCFECSDEQLKLTIEYILRNS